MVRPSSRAAVLTLGWAVGCVAEVDDGGVEAPTEWVVAAPTATADLLPLDAVLWLDPDPVRAVVVLESHVDGQAAFVDPQWRARAASLDLALMTVDLTTGEEDVAVGLPDQAAARVEELLDAAAARTGRNELAEAPVVVFGHSSASHLMVPVGARLADRLAGFVAYRGGALAVTEGELADQGLLAPAFLAVPGLILAAGAEPQGLRDASYLLHDAGRARGAPWTLAVEPGGAHVGLGTTSQLTLPFLEMVATRRLGADGLVPLAAEAPWTGSLTLSREPETSDDFGEDTVVDAVIGPLGRGTEAGTWFATEALARGWLSFEGVED